MKNSIPKREIEHIGSDGTIWEIVITKNNIVLVTAEDETREYVIPEEIVEVERDMDYITLHLKSGKKYQFKFEDGSFLVGDIFDNNYEFIDSFASHVFGEE